MEQGSLVAVTVVGKDRPGIVAGVTGVLFEAGCNLLDATSTILRGHFSMMLIVSAPAETGAEELEARLAIVADQLGLIATVRSVEQAAGQVSRSTHVVSVYGADQPGIVYKVARHLSETGVNITALSSRVIGSEERPVYALLLEIAAAADVEEGLQSLRDELGLDLSVNPISSEVL
ncbi:MAG: ACT domain-containing protein [Actinomycetota bacterium]|nr:ACT domain-containing protein [Actinomycetota bacterium]